MKLNTPNVKSLNGVYLFALSPSFSMLTQPVLRLRRLAAHLCKATMSTNHSSSSPPSPASGKAATAAILIIGDEILKVNTRLFLVQTYIWTHDVCKFFVKPVSLNKSFENRHLWFSIQRCPNFPVLKLYSLKMFFVFFVLDVTAELSLVS